MRFPFILLPAASVLLAGLLTSGCRSFDPAQARREQTDSFTSNLAVMAQASACSRPPEPIRRTFIADSIAVGSLM